jgi:hypothetical protein
MWNSTLRCPKQRGMQKKKHEKFHVVLDSAELDSALPWTARNFSVKILVHSALSWTARNQFPRCPRQLRSGFHVVLDSAELHISLNISAKTKKNKIILAYKSFHYQK